MDDLQIEKLMSSSALAWVALNEFKNENQQPIEFRDHRFMIDIYADNSEDIVCRKSAQVGFSVMAILKSLWETKYNGQNVIYALPSRNIVNDFVKPKVNPLIAINPKISGMLSDDSVSYKRVGDRNLFFKGGFSDRDAISITGDILVIDEYDRMPNMQVVNTFDSRLQASKNPRRWRFSNPSQVGYGVDGLYQDSDQMHWLVTCQECGYRTYIDFAKEEAFISGEGETFHSHYVDPKRRIYACGQCDAELSDDDRRNGLWIARYPDRNRRGYWISQMMAPWVTAARILDQKDDSSIEFFYNFVLGKAYTPTDMVVNREVILRACAPSTITKQHVVIGVDQDAGGQYFVAMTPQGIFAHGYVDGWEKIEHLKLMYNAIVVCDPNPYSAMPKQMAAKYSDWYNCYFKSIDGLSAVQWKEKEKVVYADRTRAMDIVANEIVTAKLLFREHAYDIEDIIAHWHNLYRTTVEKEDGRMKSEWIKKDGKQSDYPFAMLYARIGLSQLMGGQSEFIEPDVGDVPTNVTIVEAATDNSGDLTIDLGSIVEDTMADFYE